MEGDHASSGTGAALSLLALCGSGSLLSRKPRQTWPCPLVHSMPPWQLSHVKWRSAALKRAQGAHEKLPGSEKEGRKIRPYITSRWCSWLSHSPHNRSVRSRKVLSSILSRDNVHFCSSVLASAPECSSGGAGGGMGWAALFFAHGRMACWPAPCPFWGAGSLIAAAHPALFRVLPGLVECLCARPHMTPRSHPRSHPPDPTSLGPAACCSLQGSWHPAVIPAF